MFFVEFLNATFGAFFRAAFFPFFFDFWPADFAPGS